MDKNQELTIQAFYDKWLKIGLCTEPADRRNAEWAVRWLYNQTEMEQPKIEWCSSPFALRSEIPPKSPGIRIEDPIIEERSPSGIHRQAVELFRVLNQTVFRRIAMPIGVALNMDMERERLYFTNTNSSPMIGVQHLAGRVGFLDYISTVHPDLQQKITGKDTLYGLTILAQSAGWMFPDRHTCYISERHNILHLDEENRLHCENGMAVAYPDGFGVWSWHGTIVSEDIVNRNFSVDSINNQPNIEIRRVMIEIYGIETFLVDSNAKLVHSDGFGELYRKEWIQDESLVMVKVINSSPELDGTYKDYFIRVPPNMETAEQAVAWTFNHEKGDYKPEKET